MVLLSKTTSATLQLSRRLLTIPSQYQSQMEPCMVMGTAVIPRESRGFAGETCGITAWMEWPVAGLPRGWKWFPYYGNMKHGYSLQSLHFAQYLLARLMPIPCKQGHHDWPSDILGEQVPTMAEIWTSFTWPSGDPSSINIIREGLLQLAGLWMSDTSLSVTVWTD